MCSPQNFASFESPHNSSYGKRNYIVHRDIRMPIPIEICLRTLNQRQQTKQYVYFGNCTLSCWFNNIFPFCRNKCVFTFPNSNVFVPVSNVSDIDINVNTHSSFRTASHNSSYFWNTESVCFFFQYNFGSLYSKQIFDKKHIFITVSSCRSSLAIGIVFGLNSVKHSTKRVK